MGIYTEGLKNCVHLNACTLSTDGTMTPEILRCLGMCPELTDMTFGREYSFRYEPMDLVQLLHLCKISLIHPACPFS